MTEPPPKRTKLSDAKRRPSNRLKCNGQCGKEGCDEEYDRPSKLDEHIEGGFPCPVPGCDKSYTQKGSLYTHIRRDHEELCCKVDGSCAQHGVPEKKKRNLFPSAEMAPLGITKADFGFVKKRIDTSLKHDVKSDRSTDYVKSLWAQPGMADRIHELTIKLFKWWFSRSPTFCDTIGGTQKLRCAPYETFQPSLDRIDNSKDHFISGDNPFANLNVVPLFMNTARSLLKIHKIVPAIREFIIKESVVTVDVDDMIKRFKTRPKCQKKNKLYRLYNNEIQDTKRRAKNRNQQVPEKLEYETWLDDIVFPLLRTQGGRCAISNLIIAYNFEGPVQYHISIDRIDSTNLSYWDIDNVRLVISAMSNIDNAAKMTYDDGESSGHAVSRDVFMKYIGIEQC